MRDSATEMIVSMTLLCPILVYPILRVQCLVVFDHFELCQTVHVYGYGSLCLYVSLNAPSLCPVVPCTFS